MHTLSHDLRSLFFGSDFDLQHILLYHNHNPEHYKVFNYLLFCIWVMQLACDHSQHVHLHVIACCQSVSNLRLELPVMNCQLSLWSGHHLVHLMIEIPRQPWLLTTLLEHYIHIILQATIEGIVSWRKFCMHMEWGIYTWDHMHGITVCLHMLHSPISMCVSMP